MILSIENIVLLAVQLLISGLVFLLWQDRKAMQIEVGTIRKEMNSIRFNYLNRFDDMKEHISAMQLKIIERISILETRLDRKLKLGDE